MKLDEIPNLGFKIFQNRSGGSSAVNKNQAKAPRRMG